MTSAVCQWVGRLLVTSAVKGLNYVGLEYIRVIYLQTVILSPLFNQGATIQSPGEGGAGVFVADKLFISTLLGGALKMSNFKFYYMFILNSS